MSGREIIKAIKIKLILNKLSKAKEAAMREFLGLPPKQSWTSECLTNVLTCVKDQILHIFCPCCIYDINRNKKRLACLSSPTFKEFMGFLSGLVFLLFMFLIMVFQMDVHPKTAYVVCGLGSLVLSLLMAFSLSVRCLVILTIPQFFSGKGRMFLLMYALFLVMNHPVKNTFVNVTVMSQSATCGQEMALNETKDLIKAATAPLESMMTSIRKVVNKLTRFSNSLRATYSGLKRTVSEIGSTIASAAEWLINITDRCKASLGSPYKQCIEAFKQGEQKCRLCDNDFMVPRRLRILWLDGTQRLEEIDKLGFLKGLCKGISALDFLCHLTKVGQVLCFVVEIFKRFIVQPIDTGTRKALSSAQDMFYFNVTIDYKYNYSFTQSKSYTQIRKDITNEIKSYMDTYMTLIGYLQNLLLLTLIFVLLKALIYRYRWLTSDRYDNTYVTFTVLDLNERRIDKGKAGIIPLTYEEEMKYISDASSSMTKKELLKLATGLVLFIFSAFNAGFYLFCDYGLYSVLFLIKKNFGKATKAPVPPHTKLHVVGRGPMADMYKSIVGLFEPIAASHVSIDVTPCVPNPSEPDWNVYRTIGIIYLVCLIMTIGEAYALRLRHMIMGCYYPKRERKRAIWLYNHIMKTRGGLMASARKAIKDRHEGSAVTEHISLKGQLAAMFPICEKIFKFFGWEVKSCLYCGREGKPDDYVHFVHCHYFDCDAIYCVDCYADLDNICAVCNNAVEMDGSGDSEEIDSSIDERDRLKKAIQRKRRNEKIEALQAERTTSRVMNRFRTAFGGPSPSNRSVSESQQVNNKEERSSESETDTDTDMSEHRVLLKRPRNVNKNSRIIKKRSKHTARERRTGRYIKRNSHDSRDKRYLRETSSSNRSDVSDCEVTSTSSCDTDDLDYSYQYTSPHIAAVSNADSDIEAVVGPTRRTYDFVSYDIYSDSDGESDDVSPDRFRHVAEPVPFVMRRQ